MKIAGKQDKGFTIIELMIATSVFSIILLVALTGFLGIGRLFYKGMSVSTTQQAATDILTDITDGVQAAETISPRYDKASGVSYYCLGNIRYTYQIGHKVDSTLTNFSSEAGTGLVRDTLPGGSDCKPPCPEAPGICQVGETRWNQPTELLGDRMRLEVFSVQSIPSISPNYYNIKIVVFYGDDAELHYDDPTDRSTVTCTGSSRTQQFCAVAKYNTSIYKGSKT
jgi:prepilin-type N-terminal cleavage/methylation domain-containing protein